ncbi:MAG: site-specific DNA-methyltransferase [Actinomycetota bacterium]|nr:site-specific DNA-methyltransferase [Actinomycetota bacterium]
MGRPRSPVAPDPANPRRREATSTRAFGTGRRESHDASAFYDQFAPPVVSTDAHINPCRVQDQLICGDSRDMGVVDDASVALVVTSPPYFAAKEYEQAAGAGNVAGTYVEYLTMLRDVFAECVRVLEPGGRIAVNVANLGRKPYRSLSADVIRILGDELGLLLRGEVVWVKAEGATGSCAWGSYASSAAPAIRDVSERIILASKGRFDRALTRAQRSARDLPHESTISAEEFMALTLDVWRFPTASARRIGHPAPFPIELPRRVIELLTYRGDTVLDPFMGSGQVALAAIDTGRHYVGFDLDDGYVELARRRLGLLA